MAITDIVATGFDAGIRVGNWVDRDMIAVRVMDGIQFGAVASPDYLARHGTPTSLEHLLAHNCIRLRFAGGVLQPWRFTEDGKIIELDVEGSVVVNDSDLAVRAALDGVGVHYGHTECIAPLIAQRRLVALLNEHAPPPTEPFFLYYPSRRQNTAALQVFIEFLRSDAKMRAADGRAASGYVASGHALSGHGVSAIAPSASISQS